MNTTIKISKETKRLLDIRKKDTKKTYDEIVKESLQSPLRAHETYGKYNLNGWNKKEDRLDLDDSN